MNIKKYIEKLEQNLSHYMIEEACKKDPSRRGSPEMYKYKGLSLNIDLKAKNKEKTLKVRIGSLEAEFKINNGDKASGGLAPEDEKMIMLWLARNENTSAFKAIFSSVVTKKELPIIPFDLEDVFEKA